MHFALTLALLAAAPHPVEAGARQETTDALKERTGELERDQMEKKDRYLDARDKLSPMARRFGVAVTSKGREDLQAFHEAEADYEIAKDKVDNHYLKLQGLPTSRLTPVHAETDKLEWSDLVAEVARSPTMDPIRAQYGKGERGLILKNAETLNGTIKLVAKGDGLWVSREAIQGGFFKGSYREVTERDLRTFGLRTYGDLHTLIRSKLADPQAGTFAPFAEVHREGPSLFDMVGPHLKGM